MKGTNYYMRQEVEIEYKNLLTETEYNKLKEIYFDRSSTHITQNNYYFDTKDSHLKSAACALRIRTKDGSAEMTLKTPFEGHHNETTLDLSIEKASELISAGYFSLPEDIHTVLIEQGVSFSENVFIVAQLKTERLEIKKPHSIIVLDKSYYSNEVDYELEVEADSISIGKNVFNTILKNNKIPKRATENKIARAFNATQ